MQQFFHYLLLMLLVYYQLVYKTQRPRWQHEMLRTFAQLYSSIYDVKEIAQVMSVYPYMSQAMKGMVGSKQLVALTIKRNAATLAENPVLTQNDLRNFLAISVAYNTYIISEEHSLTQRRLEFDIKKVNFEPFIQALFVGKLVEQIAHLVGGEALVLHDFQHGAGVSVTTARAHHQAFERSETHGGIYAAPAIYGTDACAVADMARDDFLILLLHAEELAYAVCHEAVARAVSAIAANLVLLIIFVRHGVEISLGRHGLMECRVEDEHLREIRQQSLHGLIAFEVGRIVEGSQIHIRNPFLQHLVVHETAFGEAASSHDAMAGSSNFIDVLDGTVFRMQERVKHHLDAFSVSGAVEGDDFRLAVDFCLEECAIESDFLDSTCGEHALVVHFIELVLDGA